MANFEQAWRISASWEGNWTAKPENTDEEKYNSTWWGTNGGATGRFMRDFLGQTWKATDKLKFQRLSLDQVGQQIWKPTRWKWLRGDEILSQDIANLLFDWGVRRWNSLTVYPIVKNGRVTGYGSGLAAALNVPTFSIFQQVTMKKTGGNPPSSTDGFYILTPQAIKLINAYPNQVELFNRLKTLRKSIDNPITPSIVARYNAFNFGATYPKQGGAVVLASNTTGSKYKLFNANDIMNEFIIYWVFPANSQDGFDATPFVKDTVDAALKAWNQRGFIDQYFEYDYITPAQASKKMNSTIKENTVLVWSKKLINGTSHWAIMRSIGTKSAWQTAFYNLFGQIATEGKSDDSAVIPDTSGDGSGNTGTGTGTGAGGNGMGGGKWLWLIGAAASGYGSVRGKSPVEQVGFGGLAGYCLYNYLKK